jgi:hypothetical protein
MFVLSRKLDVARSSTCSVRHGFSGNIVAGLDLDEEELLEDELPLVDELLFKLLFEDWLEVLCEELRLSKICLTKLSGSELLLGTLNWRRRCQRPRDPPPLISTHR